MKINIEVKADLDFEIDVTENILKKVLESYGGDFEEWAINNYEDYLNFDDLEDNVYLYECSFDEVSARELLEEGGSMRLNIDRGRLIESVCNAPGADQIKSLRLDVALLESLLPFTHTKSQKSEINCIHLKGNFAEATNGSSLIRYESHFYNPENIFFPTYFIEPLSRGGECFIGLENKIFLKYENKWYESSILLNPEHYPKTEEIVIKNIGEKRNSTISFKDIKISNVKINEFLEAAEIDLNGEIFYVDKEGWDNSLRHDVRFIGINNNEPKDSRLYLFGKNFQIIFMPIRINSDSIVSKL